MKKKVSFYTAAVLITATFFLPSFCIAQSAKVTVQAGGSVPFTFNSLNKYNEGSTLANWTTLKLNLDDPLQSSWKLTLQALSPTIQSDGSSADLALSTIEARVEIVSTNDPSINNAYSPIVLSDNPLGDIILSGTKVVDLEVIININYDCGTEPTNMLLGKAADFYYIDLSFQLSSVP